MSLVRLVSIALVGAVLAGAAPVAVPPPAVVAKEPGLGSGPIPSPPSAAMAARVAASLSRSVAEVYGPYPGRRGGAARDWFMPAEVAVHTVTRGPLAGRVVGVPASARVHADGTVTFPDAVTASSPTARLATGEAAPAAALGSFSGPWGRERLDTWVVYDVDGGGLLCNTTRGEVRMRALRRRLKDTSTRHDYVGIDVRAVAEITGFASNCDDYIGSFSVGTWSQTPGAIWLDQDPVAGSTGSCTTWQAGVGVSAGVAIEGSASVTRAFTRCERWRVTNGVPVPPHASRHYDVRYEHNGVRDNEQREAGLVAIVRVPRGAALNPVYGLGIDVENAR